MDQTHKRVPLSPKLGLCTVALASFCLASFPGVGFATGPSGDELTQGCNNELCTPAAVNNINDVLETVVVSSPRFDINLSTMKSFIGRGDLFRVDLTVYANGNFAGVLQRRDGEKTETLRFSIVDNKVTRGDPSGPCGYFGCFLYDQSRHAGGPRSFRPRPTDVRVDQ